MKNTSPFLIICSASEFKANVTEIRFLSGILPQSYNLAFSSLKKLPNTISGFLDKDLNEGLLNLLLTLSLKFFFVLSTRKNKLLIDVIFRDANQLNREK